MKPGRKTRDQLARENAKLRRRIEALEARAASGASIVEELRKVSREHGERVKELNCLYAISRLREKQGLSWEGLLSGIAEIIPSAWQYPDDACARLVLGANEYRSPNFRRTMWRQAAGITVHGKPVGSIEVCYLRKKPKRDEGPFLKDERRLLEAVAERLEKIVEHRRAEEKAEEQQKQLVHLDKMAALGTLVSGVAHEINNPNGFIMLNTPLLIEVWDGIVPILDEYAASRGDFVAGGLSYDEARKNVPLLFSGILDGARRIRNIVANLKGFARSDTADITQAVDINAVVKSALTLLANTIRKSTKRFTAVYGNRLPVVKGNFQQLEQVVINLVQNACEALQDNQRAVGISTAYDRRDRRIVVTVRDEGVGIPAEDLPRITDPFFTTKRTTGGTGLGLSVSEGIVESHGGALSFASVPRRGTTVTLTLPVSGNSHRRGAAT